MEYGMSLQIKKEELECPHVGVHIHNAVNKNDKTNYVTRQLKIMTKESRSRRIWQHNAKMKQTSSDMWTSKSDDTTYDDESAYVIYFNVLTINEHRVKDRTQNVDDDDETRQRQILLHDGEEIQNKLMTSLKSK